MPKSQIKNEIIDILSQETLYYTKEYGQQIQAQISKWLKRKKDLNTRLHNYYKQSKKIEQDLIRLNAEGKSMTMSSANLRKMFYRYTAASRHVADLKTMEDIKEFYKQGYVLAHKIREDITKQNLTYSILTEYNNEKMELHLNLSQFLDVISVDLQKVKNITREGADFVGSANLKARKSNVNKYIKEQLQKEANQLAQVLHKIDKQLLWDRLAELTPHGKNHKENNFGHIYEVYYILRNVKRYKTINYIGNRQMGLYEKLLKNAHNSTEGWKIGDVGTEQLKSVFNSAAGIANIASIESLLINIQNAFAKSNPEEIKKELKRIFTTQVTAFDNKLDKAAEEAASEAIDKFIDGINRT